MVQIIRRVSSKGLRINIATCEKCFALWLGVIDRQNVKMEQWKYTGETKGQSQSLLYNMYSGDDVQSLQIWRPTNHSKRSWNFWWKIYFHRCKFLLKYAQYQSEKRCEHHKNNSLQLQRSTISHLSRLPRYSRRDFFFFFFIKFSDSRHGVKKEKRMLLSDRKEQIDSNLLKILPWTKMPFRTNLILNIFKIEFLNFKFYSWKTQGNRQAKQYPYWNIWYHILIQ